MDEFIGEVATITNLVTVRADGRNYNPILLGRQRMRILKVYFNPDEYGVRFILFPTYLVLTVTLLVKFFRKPTEMIFIILWDDFPSRDH